jgi:Raf kinase inhibitor-like YbhB/YbcL family protein
MRHPLRFALAVTACALLVTVAAACGSSGNDAAATSEPLPATSAPAPTTAVAEPAATTAAADEAPAFTLTSTAFGDGEAIPREFTCQGDGVSPALAWSGVPDGTKSLALLVVDPDAAVDNGFTHWVLAGIDPNAQGLAESTTVGTPGPNGAGEPGWTGPCPPSGNHRYVFTLYALAAPIDGTVDRAAIEAAGAASLGQAVLTGTYEKR